MGTLNLIIAVEQLLLKGPNMDILNTQLANLSVSATDAGGNVVPLPAGLVWTSSNPAVMTVEQSSTGATCIARTVDGQTGAVTVFVTDPTSGITSPAIAFDVRSALANLTISVDSITNK